MSNFTIHVGDCREVLKSFNENSVDAVVTDPPYALNFMGKNWDTAGVAFAPHTWKDILQVVKPGGYLLAFGGTRTYHRLTCAVEDAGWYITDSIASWTHGQGFPKGKSQLKPAWEPIIVARKPSSRILPLQIDASRVGTHTQVNSPASSLGNSFTMDGGPAQRDRTPTISVGRYPPNLLLTHVESCTDEQCTEGCPVLEMDRQSGTLKSGMMKSGQSRVISKDRGGYHEHMPDSATLTDTYGDSGGASRFFPTFRYMAKASTRERTLPDGSRISHPTQKPEKLMEWLVKLVAAPGQTVLDPFMGSGTTGIACLRSGVHFIGIEQDAQYAREAEQRLQHEST